ncbi:glycosyltransferase family 4 protein [Donghicola sp. XS_ASV15]|uniref:glycosyltransferase family 4 protein n=1 Tax=Donghicola sp. XS_ASV15 TaxID=3241295 RepID=UPI003511EE0B
MKIWAIVSDFPKVTETFALANVQAFRNAGHKADVFHIKPFRSAEIVHPEARGIVDDALHLGYAAPRTVLLAALAAIRSPLRTARVIRRIVGAFRAEPRHLGISLMLLPQGLALGQLARRSGVDRLYAEFAGYPATVAWIASRTSGIPFGFSAHAHDIFITQGLLDVKARAASFVRTISDFNRRFLVQKACVSQDKIHVIRCGVAPERTQSALPVAPTEGEPFHIVFVGALLPRKGVDVLLKALSHLPKTLNWRLTIVGGGSQEASLRVAAEDLPDGCVDFLGALPSDQVQQTMAEAHLVVVPSIEGEGGRSEGIPVVLMEAMAQGRPVIASRLSGIPELVEEGLTGWLVLPGDARVLATRIEQVFGNYQGSLGLAAAGQARVRAHYNIEQNAAELLALIEGD